MLDDTSSGDLPLSYSGHDLKRRNGDTLILWLISVLNFSDHTLPWTYNPGQNCWDNSRFSPSPHKNVDFSLSPISRLVHRSVACFSIVWGKGDAKKAAKEEHALLI